MEHAPGPIIAKVAPGAQDDSERQGIPWWRACEWMMLADGRMKEAFRGRNCSPRSIAQYRRFAQNDVGQLPSKDENWG